MYESDIQKLLYLRNLGFSYSAISRVLHISRNTLKSYCRRRGIVSNAEPKSPAENRKLSNCKYCDAPLVPNAKGPMRDFCDHTCRRKYNELKLENSYDNLVFDIPYPDTQVSQEGLAFFRKRSDELVNQTKEDNDNG